ncbi:MAG: hypothetical protein SGCHY_000538 [Lobulomycetales sp.]
MDTHFGPHDFSPRSGFALGPEQHFHLDGVSPHSPQPPFSPNPNGGMVTASSQAVDIQAGGRTRQPQHSAHQPQSSFGNGSFHSHYSTSLPIHNMHISHHQPSNQKHASPHQPFAPGSLGGSFQNDASSFSESLILAAAPSGSTDYLPAAAPEVSSVDKRRKRRESHNAVERRRRDNINDRIQDLNSLLPPDVLSPANAKPNKGFILKRSVDYVRSVNAGIRRMDDRIKELEQLVALFCNERGVNVHDVGKGLMVPIGTKMEVLLGCEPGPALPPKESTFDAVFGTGPESVISDYN